MPARKGYRGNKRYRASIPRAGNLHKTVPGRLRVTLRASDTIQDRIGVGSPLKKSEFLLPASPSSEAYAPTHSRILLDPSVFGKDRMYKYPQWNTGFVSPIVNLSPAFFYQFGQIYQSALIESVSYTFRIVNMGPQMDFKGVVQPWSSVLNHYMVPLTRKTCEPVFTTTTTAGGATGWYGATANSTQYADSLADCPGAYCKSTDLNSRPEVTMKKTINLYYAHNKDPNRSGCIMRSSLGTSGMQLEVAQSSKDSSLQYQTTWTSLTPATTTDNEWPIMALITTSPFIDQHKGIIEDSSTTNPNTRFTEAFPTGTNDQQCGFVFQVEITAHYDISLWGIRNVDATFAQA